jgi:hypothetical protein
LAGPGRRSGTAVTAAHYTGLCDPYTQLAASGPGWRAIRRAEHP